VLDHFFNLTKKCIQFADFNTI